MLPIRLHVFEYFPTNYCWIVLFCCCFCCCWLFQTIFFLFAYLVFFFTEMHTFADYGFLINFIRLEFSAYGVNTFMHKYFVRAVCLSRSIFYSLPNKLFSFHSFSISRVSFRMKSNENIKTFSVECHLYVHFSSYFIGTLFTFEILAFLTDIFWFHHTHTHPHHMPKMLTSPFSGSGMPLEV